MPAAARSRHLRGFKTFPQKRKNLKIKTEYQKITHKIAVFDTENDVKEFEEFRYHSYPFNQISGNHLGLVEFMTDTHPVRTEREASDYIERVKLFDESLSANLVWLEKQKELDIYAPIFVVDHVIKQLYELIGYKDKDNPLMKIFVEKIMLLGTLDLKSAMFFFYKKLGPKVDENIHLSSK